MNEEKNNVVGQNATLQTENLTETNVSNQQGETLSNQMGASVNAASPVQNMNPSMPTVPRMENPLNQDVQVSMQTQKERNPQNCTTVHRQRSHRTPRHSRRTELQVKEF